MKEHKGAEVVGVTGFCWGGMIAMKAASIGAEAEGSVKAGGNVHPAMLSAELAEDVSQAEVREQREEGVCDALRERERERERLRNEARLLQEVYLLLRWRF